MDNCRLQARDWLSRSTRKEMEDPDAAEGKVFCTWLGQMRRKEE